MSQAQAKIDRIIKVRPETLEEYQRRRAAAGKPCPGSLETRDEGEWWANREEIFHCD